MSLPENTLSLHPLPAPFVGGRAYPVTPLVDYETGGIALDDASEGLLYQVWRARVLEDDDTGEDYVMLDAENVDAFEVIRGHKITQFSFTFDRNMRLHYTWVEGGVAFFRWYDTQIPGMRVDELGPQYLTPRLAHDDKRSLQSGIADIILAYLYRYDTEVECQVPQTVGQLDAEAFPVRNSRGCPVTREETFSGSVTFYQECSDGLKEQIPADTGAYRLADGEATTGMVGGSLWGYQTTPILGPGLCPATVRDLRYVQQRDRYQTERTLLPNVEAPGIVKIGLNRQLRFQFMLEVAR